MKQLLFLFFFSLILQAAELPNAYQNSPFSKSTLWEWKFFDVNNIYCTINSAGPYADYLRTNTSGLFWPKGTYKTAVHTSGIWVIGKHRPTGVLRTATQVYRSEFQPGVINGIFNTASNDLSVASNSLDNRYRIYKINKNDNAATNPDYAQWPGDLGAPFNDVNGNGKWDNGTDTPLLRGDQTLWCVYNDLDTALHRKMGTTPPMGIEVQTTYYGFNTSGPLQNTMFIQWKIINKSDAYYDSTFIGLFSDFDLGDANDDLDGYDTTLSLAYVFNADNDDAGASGYGRQPPACGTTFLGGKPSIVPYAYPIYIKSQEPYGDVSQGSPLFPLNVFNYLRGLTKTTGVPNINPFTNQPDRFAFTGDPITNTGWTRLNAGFTGGDVRSLLSLGPTTLAPGDTQEVNAAFVIAQGNDRLESLKKLRESVSFVRNAFENNFSFPTLNIQKEFTADSVISTFSLNCNSGDAKGVALQIISEQDNTVIATVPLFDDGTAGDAQSGDGIFTRTIKLPVSPTPIRIHADITHSNNTITRWQQLAANVTLSNLSIKQPAIYSDDGNKDGKVQPGENIRYGVEIVNPHNFRFQNVTISTMNSPYLPHIHLNTVEGGSTTKRNYNPSDETTYLTFSLPREFAGTSYKGYVLITDSLQNKWIDSLTFTVDVYTKRVTVPKKISGRSSLSVEVVITDKHAVKNHVYLLKGVDTNNAPYGIQLRDSTANVELLPVMPIGLFTTEQQINHLIPQTEGFKLNIVTLNYLPTISQTYLPSDSMKWFSIPLIASSIYYNKPRSPVHYADVPNIIIKFSAIASFNDWNSNGRFDADEPYTFLTEREDRTQKAYLYSGTNKFLGFIDVPFAVYDASTDSLKKLTVVLHRTSDPSSALQWRMNSDNIYIMANAYNADGVLYDSTKGGINLLPQFNPSGTLPYYYYFRLQTTQEPLKEYGDFLISYLPGLSSRDVFIFRPTENKIEDLVPPTTYVVHQNYPNPFNSVTTIRYSIPKQSHASIIIYNILGQRVRTLLSDIHRAGTYEIDWNGRDDNGTLLTSGVYIYRFSSEGTRITKKMLLLK